MKKAMKKLKAKLNDGAKSLSSFASMDMLAAAMVAVGLVLIGYAVMTSRSNPAAGLTKGSVMILRGDKRGGGSGTVIASRVNESLILTNAHVCGVVENGGVVVTDTGAEHRVTTFKTSILHDLCLIRVAADLGVSAKIASAPPKMYSKATVIGHPRLSPTTITEGVFSKRVIIDVITNIRPCTQDDISKNPDNGILCFFLGGIPVVTTYETQFTTALISPGSSGSPVYNEAGEIAGVIFAGAGDPSPGFIVPLESVLNFLSPSYENGSDLYSSLLPNNRQEINADVLKKNAAFTTGDWAERLNKLCNDREASQRESVQKLCKINKKDMLWRQ